MQLSHLLSFTYLATKEKMSTLRNTTLLATTVLMIISMVSAQPPGPAPLPMAIPGSEPSTAPESSPAFGPAAPEPAGNECLAPVLNMTDCLTYVEMGSKMATPDKNCCPELAGLVDSNPICLCQLLGSNITEQYGIKIDVSRALKLPNICKVSTPPVSLCSVAGYPVGAPLSSPAYAPGPGVQPPKILAPGPSIGSSIQDSGGSSIASSADAFIVFLGFAFVSAFL